MRSGGALHVVMTVNAAWNIWNFRRALVTALLTDGHRVTVLAPEDDAVPALRELGCDFIPLPMDVRGLNPIRDLALLARLRRAFEQAKPDIVLGFTVKNNLYGAMAARSLGIPFLPNVTGLGTAFLSGKLMQFMAERLCRFAFSPLEAVFFQNEDDLELFVSRRIVREGQARLIPGSGIDLAHFAPAPLPAPADGPVFLMVARLLRDKGLFEYAEAAQRVRQQHPKARFLLLGPDGSANRSGVATTIVESWAETLGVNYLGSSDDVRPHIAAATCVVLPSYREGAPRTLLEAAAMARPVITTDVPGCRSAVDDGVSGLLCQARSGESLANACLRFLSLSADQQRKMGAAGRSKMEREFDQAIVLRAYRQAIVDCHRSPRRHRPSQVIVRASS